MARAELILRLEKQLARVDKALMTATNGEVLILESIRKDIEKQIRELSQNRPQLRAA